MEIPMTGAEKIGTLAVDLANAAAKAKANGDDVHALFFSIKAAECVALAKSLGWMADEQDAAEAMDNGRRT
jgi:hypothetical protein